MYHTSQKCQLWIKSTVRLSCQRLFFSLGEICVLPLCNQLWRNPDICCHSCHLLDRTSFAVPLHGILVAIFLARYKGHSSLDFCVCVRACMCMCLKWYCYHFWRLITVMWSLLRVKDNKFHSSKGKKKSLVMLSKNTFKMKQYILRF